MAVAGLICIIVSMLLFWAPVVTNILWVLGLVFSLIGMSNAKRGASGRGMALAGVILTAIALPIYVTILVLGQVYGDEIEEWSQEQEQQQLEEAGE